MNDTIEALTKLANELTDRVDALEKENDALRGTAAQLAKQASEAPAPAAEAPKVSDGMVDDTLSALLKVGALNADQLKESRQLLTTDPEAPFRLLRGLLDAQLQAKTASDESVSGGFLAGSASKRDASEDCLDRMIKILDVD